MEQLTKFFTSIGFTGGIISSVAALLALIPRFQIITLMTSTLPERVFLSKEKRLFKQVIESSLLTVGTAFYFVYVLFYSYVWSYRYYKLLSITMLIFVLLGFGIAIMINLSKRVRENVRERILSGNFYYKSLLFLLYLLFFISYFTVVPYFWGSYSANVAKKVSEQSNHWASIVVV